MVQKSLPKKYRCTNYEKCKYETPKFVKLHKLNGGFYCDKCANEKRKQFREHVKRDVLGVRTKEQIHEGHLQWLKERQLIQPKIKGSIHRTHSNQLHLYLTSEEKNFIYKKLIKSGYSDEQIHNRIKTMKEHLSTMVQKMREQRKTDKEISEKFKVEFNKLVEGFK